MKIPILLNSERFEVEVLTLGRNQIRFQIGGREYTVEHERNVPSSQMQATTSRRTPGAVRAIPAGGIPAPMPGVIGEVLVSIGSKVAPGDILLKIEAMKMQNNITSPAHGIVTAIAVQVGDEVGDGQLLVQLSDV